MPFTSISLQTADLLPLTHPHFVGRSCRISFWCCCQFQLGAAINNIYLPLVGVQDASMYVCVSACLPCVPCLPLTFLQSSHPQSTHLISPMAYGVAFFLVFFFSVLLLFIFYMFVTCLVYIMSNLWVFFMIPVQEGGAGGGSGKTLCSFSAATVAALRIINFWYMRFQISWVLFKSISN